MQGETKSSEVILEMSEGHCICSTSTAYCTTFITTAAAPPAVAFAGWHYRTFSSVSPTYQVQFQQLSSWHFRTESQSQAKSRNCLGKSNPFSAIQFTTPTLSYHLSYARSQARGGRNTNQISTSRKRRLDAVIQQQSFHITIPPCCKSSDKIRYRSPLTKPYLSEGETLNIKGYLQSRPAFYWILLQ